MISRNRLDTKRASGRALSLLLGAFSLVLVRESFGAVPTFQSFNTNDFGTTNNRITMNAAGSKLMSKQQGSTALSNWALLSTNVFYPSNNPAGFATIADLALRTNAITGGFTNSGGTNVGPIFILGTNITLGINNENSNINCIVIGYNLISAKDDSVFIGPQMASAIQVSKNGTALYTNISAFGSTNSFIGGIGSAGFYGAVGSFTTLNSGTATATNGLFLPTNSLASWPAAARTRGEAFWGNSNGWIYLITSDGTAGTAWTKTNLMATP
jgi:hypothetical protein